MSSFLAISTSKQPLTSAFSKWKWFPSLMGSFWGIGLQNRSTGLRINGSVQSIKTNRQTSHSSFRKLHFIPALKKLSQENLSQFSLKLTFSQPSAIHTWLYTMYPVTLTLSSIKGAVWCLPVCFDGLKTSVYSEPSGPILEPNTSKWAHQWGEPLPFWEGRGQRLFRGWNR